MRYGSVYLLTNQRTGEQYVGQTIKSVKTRWNAHCRSAANPKFKVQYNIHTHGKNVFTVEELFVAFSKSALDWAEKHFIQLFSPILNATSGGSGSARKLTQKECERISIETKVRWADPVWREKTLAAIRQGTQTDAAKERGKRLAAYNGSAIRWAGHVKKVPIIKNRSETLRRSWENPDVRIRRLNGQKRAFANPEVRAKISAAQSGRIMPQSAVQKSARAKWKPIYCPELQTSFLSQKHAAEHLGVLKTSICNAVKSKGKVSGMYTLVRVA